MRQFEISTNAATKAAWLVIKAGGSALAKTANAINYVINGSIYAEPAGDLPSLAGINIADGYTRVIAVQLNAAGTFSFVVSDSVANTATMTTVSFLPPQQLYSLVGRIMIKTVAAAFIWGTTDLDEVTVTTTYFDAVNSLIR